MTVHPTEVRSKGLTASSNEKKPLRVVKALETAAATTPMKIEGPYPTNPAAGVYVNDRVSQLTLGRTKKRVLTIATKPQIAPVQYPTALHFLSNRQSSNIHASPPNPAAKLVLTIAIAALTLAAKVDPPLKPIHPTQLWDVRE